jgi:hypothetical protein
MNRDERFNTVIHVMTLLRVDFHRFDLAPFRISGPETEIALRNLGSEFVTPW